jgi:peptidase YpeB-like protein
MQMLRASTSRRRVLGLAVAVAVGTGIGLGAASLWSPSGAAAPLTPRLDSITSPAGGPDVPALPSTAAPSPSPSSPSSPSPSQGLTLDDATAVAARVAPGRVVEAKEDSEPTGLQYDVTLLHADGTATTVEVDAATGRIVSTETDTDWDGS